MSKKIPMKKAVDQEAAKQKDFVTNKLLSVVTLAFIMIFALMLIDRRMRHADMYYTIFFKGMWVVAAIFAVIAIAGIVYAIVAKKRGADTSYKLCSGQNIAGVSAFISLCFFILAVSYNPETLKFLYGLVAAATLLYVIFHSYPREYFTLAAAGGFGAMGIWLVSNALSGGVGGTRYPILAGIIYALAIALIVWTALLQKNHGKCKKSGCEIYKEGAKYWPIYLVSLLVIAALTLTLVFSGAGMYIYTFALLGYVVLAGIVYTVRLI